MRKIKIFCGIAGVLLLGLMALPVAAQVTDPSPDLVTIACTNDVPNNSTTTSNLGATVDCSDYGEVAVQIKAALTGAGTTACTFTFNRSVDGTNWCTVAPYAISFTPAGATAVVTNYAITLGAIPYLKLSGITAANNSAALTNISVIVGRKPFRRD